MFLAGFLARHDLSRTEMLDRYELFAYKQWLRVYMRSKMIRHNKDNDRRPVSAASEPDKLRAERA